MTLGIYTFYVPVDSPQATSYQIYSFPSCEKQSNPTNILWLTDLLPFLADDCNTVYDIYIYTSISFFNEQPQNFDENENVCRRKSLNSRCRRLKCRIFFNR